MGTPARSHLEILAGCAALLAGLWALVGFLIHQDQRLVVEHATGSGRNLARTLAEYQDSSVRAIDLSLRQLREEWRRDPAAFDEAVARHEEHLRKENVIQVAVMGPDHWTRYSRLPLKKPLNFSDRRYVQEMTSRRVDDLYVSEPVVGRVTGRWAIQFTRPLLSPDGRYEGAIVVAVPPPALELVLQDIKLGARGVIILARADGTVLARTGGLETTRGATLAGWEGLGREGPMSGEFRLPGRFDGVERFYAWRRLQSYPLTVYVGQDVDEVLASYYRDRGLLLGGGALATLLLVALAALLMARARERQRFLEDRERLMLELHDNSIQSIYAIGLGLENARNRLQTDPGRAARAIAEAEANLNLVIQDLRTFITAERRGPYTETEFMEEIARLLPAEGEGAPRFTVDVDRTVVSSLAPRQAVHLLRIAREAVSNIVRHAGARTARLSLQRHGERLRLEIADDGVGLGARAEARLGMGLHHIEARARKLRGRASFEGAPNAGTRIAVEFPGRA